MNEGNRSPANETSPGRSSTEANGSVECPNEKNASNLQTPSPILMTPKVSRLSLSKHKRAKRERQRVMMIQRSQQSQSQSSHGINNEAAATAIHSNTKATSSSIPHNNDTQDRKNGNCGAKKTASPSALSSKKRPRIDYNIDEDDDSGNHHKGGADVTPLASSKKRRWKVDYHVNEDISDDDDLEHENGEDTNATDGHELLTQPTTAEIDAESQRRDIECSSLDVPQDSLHGSKVATAKNESRQPQNRQRRNHHQDCISPMNEIGIMSHSLAKMQAHNNEMDFETPRRSGTQKLDMLIGHNSALLGANIDGGNAKLGYNIVGADDNHNAGDEEDEDENDEEIPEGVPMDYNQKVAANRKRNQQRLIDLGLVKAVAVGKNSGEEKKLEQEDEDDSNIVSAPKATGMLFATTNNSIQHPIEKSTPGMLQIDPSLTNEHACGQKQHCNTSLFDTFPHREREITLLQSCLQNAVRQAEFTNSRPGLSINEAYIPPPIFVTGPSGTGKTCVVRGVLKKIQLDAEQGNKMQSSIPNGRASVNLGVAYIDCSTIEAYGSGVGAILENTYYQLANDFCQGEGQTRTRSRKGMQSKFTGPSVHGSILDQASLASGSDSFDSATDDESYMDSSLEMDDSLSVDGSLEHDTDGESQVILDEEELMEKKAAKERGAYRKEARVSSTSSSRPMPSNSLSRGKKRETKEAPRRSSRLKGGDVSSINVSVNKLQARRPGSGLIGLLSTPAAFGRSISQFCGVSSYNSYQRGCAFLVLDHASNLLSFTASRNKDLIHTNFLSELLLLPKVMKLNLTIIVITDKLFLENTRINNIEHPMNTLGTIVAAIVPIKCHFGVYSDKRSLRNILSTPHLMRLATGIAEASNNSLPLPIITQLYKSLLDIVIESVESTTRDIREVLRLTRMLWPVYIKPLGKFADIESSDEDVGFTTDPLTRRCLEKMGQALRPHIRTALKQCLLRPGRTIPQRIEGSKKTPSVNQIPYLGKFMLLAAYLCQRNKADHDKLLYTNARSGKRRNARNNSSHSESLTHASSQKALQQLRSDRIASFPLERMLSVFSSICNKYANDDKKETSRNDMLFHITSGVINISQLGSLSLMKCISELKQHGLINEASTFVGSLDSRKAYSKSVTSTRFICNLSREMAEDIAQDLGFPLKDYLTENQ